jgi:hypothetical protein
MRRKSKKRKLAQRENQAWPSGSGSRESCGACNFGRAVPVMRHFSLPFHIRAFGARRNAHNCAKPFWIKRILKLGVLRSSISVTTRSAWRNKSLFFLLESCCKVACSRAQLSQMDRMD